MVAFAYRILFALGGLGFAWWELRETQKEIEERYAAGEEEVTVVEILQEPTLASAGSGVAFAAVQLMGGWGAIGAMETAAVATVTRAVPPAAALAIVAKGIPAGIAGLALGAAVGIGVSRAVWGSSGEQHARDLYSGKVSPEKWWRDVKTLF
jgi:hypothetical protein